MITFINKSGNPIIRQCANCIFYDPISGNKPSGYCKQLPLLFAFTGQQTVYGITRPFYCCEKHILPNEDYLNSNAEKIEMSYNFKSKELLNNGNGA